MVSIRLDDGGDGVHTRISIMDSKIFDFCIRHSPKEVYFSSTQPNWQTSAFCYWKSLGSESLVAFVTGLRDLCDVLRSLYTWAMESTTVT